MATHKGRLDTNAEEIASDEWVEERLLCVARDGARMDCDDTGNSTFAVHRMDAR